jgi:hypothetical protein
MLKSLEYLFYKLYKVFLFINGKDDIPEWTATLAVATLVFIDLFALGIIINVFYPFYFFPEISRGAFAILLMPYTFIFYMLFIFKGKHKKIYKEYQKENELEKKRGRKKVTIYISVSIGFLFISLILMTLKAEHII